jgi:hypothetical protein
MWAGNALRDLVQPESWAPQLTDGVYCSVYATRFHHDFPSFSLKPRCATCASCTTCATRLLNLCKPGLVLSEDARSEESRGAPV